MEQIAAGDDADGGPSPAVVAIVAVVVVVVLALGAWLLTRGDDDDGALAPAASDETTPHSEPAADSTAEGENTPSSPPTTLSTETSTTPLPDTTPATALPDTGLSASIAPGVTIPVSPTSSAVPATVTPPTGEETTVPETTTETTITETTVPDASAPDTTVDEPPPSAPQDDSAVRDLVPNVAAEPEYISAPDARRALVDELLAARRHDVASSTLVSTLCATVAVTERTGLGGRWELDGRPLSSTDPVDVRPPGYGECVETNGDPLSDGAYQFVAVDSSGQTSAAGTFVAGAARRDQRFRNNGRVDVCVVLIGPATANYYESFDLRDTPIEPGATVVIPVADVRQDLRPLDCDDTALADSSFDPSAEEQNLLP
ncbi:MAG: hypothetical protein ACR2HQ_01035 [Ilumatobacteraceae bacterium]